MKSLEALETLCNLCEFYQYEKGLRPKKCPFDKNCVYKCRIERELKALEIIKEKKVNAKCIISGWSLGKYNSYKAHISLTEEEYNLLKETLY